MTAAHGPLDPSKLTLGLLRDAKERALALAELTTAADKARL